MKRFNDISNSCLILVPMFATNLRLQNGKEHWGTDPMCIHSRGFSGTEENTYLTLRIAVGKNVQNLCTIFFNTLDKNCPKVEDNFLNYFH